MLETTVSFTVTAAQSPAENTLQLLSALDENGDPVVPVAGQAQVDVAVAAVDLAITSSPQPSYT